MRLLDLERSELLLKFKKKFFRNNTKLIFLIFWIFGLNFFQKQILSDIESIQFDIEENNIEDSNIEWKKINIEDKFEREIIWEKIEDNQETLFQNKEVIKYSDRSEFNHVNIGSFNRSIVLDNSIVGPDISWLVPPGFKWNNKYKFDSSVRGRNRRNKGEKFFGWNNGDAVGQFYYQFLHNKKTSFGINFGVRSVYKGYGAAGGSTSIGEGQSLGFRLDYRISPTEGFAFGAEQLLHFDGLTDTGRDIYLTYSKAFIGNYERVEYPLNTFTFGLATGKMAEGNIKGLCSDLLGGSGTEIYHQRRLCWSPVFVFSRVHNNNFSSFFEYNSKYFLLGTSIIPFNEIPLRGTFAVQLADHIDNYKLKNFDELKWVFRLSLGF